jgi:Putative phage tail protein
VQTARRETTPSVEVLDGEVPCVFHDVQAWQIAENNLRDIWASAGKRKFSTGLKYAKHEPTDVVFVDDGADVRQVRITRRADRGSLIEWEAEDIDALMYESRANQIDFSIPAPTQPISPGAQTDAEALDLPPLTELKNGNEVAVYVAAAPYGNTARWSGAHILVSRDAGVSFGALTHVPVSSPMGITLSAMRSFAGGNIFDTTSRIRVFLNYGDLQSATEADVLNGGNAALIGNEIVQFCGVTQIDPNVYELTRFLRGRKGTEWAVSGHAESERFVLLTTRLRDIPLDIGDRNSAIMFLRAFGTGSASRFGTTERFSTQFARLMPYSPVHLFAVRHPSGVWTLRWNRRDRYMNDWNSGVDVPLSEADEVYEVEVYNAGGELLRTYRAITASSLTVPADVLGGSPTPTSITFRVFQMSDIVGRGFVGSKTITQAL